jgi:hypothetical protein
MSILTTKRTNSLFLEIERFHPPVETELLEYGTDWMVEGEDLDVSPQGDSLPMQGQHGTITWPIGVTHPGKAQGNLDSRPEMGEQLLLEEDMGIPVQSSFVNGYHQYITGLRCRQLHCPSFMHVRSGSIPAESLPS